MRSSAPSPAEAPPAAPRSSWTVGSALLGLAGVGVAAYLTQLHYDGSDALCAGVGECAEVNDSAYATIGPLPVALLGLGAYLAVLAMVAAARLRPGQAATSVMAVFGVALASVLYSGYLTYVEMYVIDAICPWCVVSASLFTAILLLAAREVFAPRPGEAVAAVEIGPEARGASRGR